MDGLDFTVLTDDQLVTLIREALREAVRRGSAVATAAESAGLEEAERARIARDAAAREADRMRAEEARRVAEQAAVDARAAAEQAKAQRLRDLAAEARSLFGSDQPEFTVSTWEKNGDKRVYVGHGYGSNWVEYYHTGNARTAPGTLKLTIGGIAADLAKHLDVPVAEAKERIKQFCTKVASWSNLRLEVNPSNAPLAEGTLVARYRARNRKLSDYWLTNTTGKGRWGGQKGDAILFPTADEALTAGRAALGRDCGFYAPEVEEDVIAEAVNVRVAFPPKATKEVK